MSIRRVSTSRPSATTRRDDPTVVHDLDRCADPDSTDTPLHRVAWLAAYAAGLSFTQSDDRECVQQLLDVEADASELDGARDLLTDWDMVDVGRHQRALRLVESAISRARGSRPSAATPAEHRWVTEWSR